MATLVIGFWFWVIDYWFPKLMLGGIFITQKPLFYSHKLTPGYASAIARLWLKLSVVTYSHVKPSTAMTWASLQPY
ncbi:hypothetical protein [Microcoleus sp.]|uniref:hypothetical protein n=1 Tax=Microcoleus sp. TaxID=44472 RepID=UPI003524C8D1